MGAELSRGYHDRTRVFGIMQMVESVGMLAAAGVLVFLEQAEDPRSFARGLSLAIGGFGAALILVAAWRLRERSEFLGRGGASPWRSFGDVLSNPHSRILIGVFFLEQLGFSTLVALMPYLSDYVLDTPGSTGLYLFGAIGAALLSIPVWIQLSRRLGKKPVWIFSILAKSVLFALAFFLGPGDFVPMMVLAVFVGVMNGSGAVVGPSLKADVVDWDEAETGERKEGSYFAAWNFVQKGAGGVAVWAIGVMLAMTGFVPNVAQSEETRLGILLLVSAVPCVLHALALLLMLRFSLDEAAHGQARRRADARLAQD
jgi:GPH family glycoside/pentoside/hexuronide:cation symporter